MYNGEDKMLTLRLHELEEYVDDFVIVEGAFTLKGDKKKLKFDLQKFSKFKDKIIYKIFDKIPTTNAWHNEANQRRYLKECFRGCEVTSDDIIILSDVDEIPDLEFLNKARVEGLKETRTCFHNYYYYNINCRNINKWPGSIFITVGTFHKKYNFDFEYIRQIRHTFPLIGKHYEYDSGGWHFSYFGDVDYIISKIKGFAHQEYNTEKYTNPETIQNLIDNKKDLFLRQEEDGNWVDVKETYLPKFIYLLDDSKNEPTAQSNILHAKTKQVIKKDIHIVYHMYCDSEQYCLALFENTLKKIKDSGLYKSAKRIHINMIGPSADVIVNNALFDTPIFQITNYCTDSSGEIDTIKLLWNISQQSERELAILYLHSKGVTRQGNKNVEDWVNYMEYFNILQWTRCIEVLENYDTCGVNLQYDPGACYAGNCWWSNSAYIKKLPLFDIKHCNLPYCYNNPRSYCEFWLLDNNFSKPYTFHNSNVDHYATSYSRGKYITK